MKAIIDIPGKLIRESLHGDFGDAHNGCCRVKLRSGAMAAVIFSSGGGWEHVSASLRTRCPTWDEMCEVRALFWGAEDCVVQYHPPASQYVNVHPFCLHLWRPVDEAVPMPPAWMVG